MFFHELFLFQKVIHTFQGKSDQFFDYHESFESIHGKKPGQVRIRLRQTCKKLCFKYVNYQLIHIQF